MTDGVIRHDPVLVAGACGFVGRRLVDRLARAGIELRCGAPELERAAAEQPDRSWVSFDPLRPSTLSAALSGVATLVYLPGAVGVPRPSAELEREAAHNVAYAAARAGVRRIVHLGGPSARGDALAPTSGSSGRILRAGPVPTIDLRADIVIGAGSWPWEIARDLALRVPVLLVPRWLDHQVQPVALDDVIEALDRAIGLHELAPGSWDLPGPETLSVRAFLRRIADAAEVRPLMWSVPGVPAWLPVLSLRFWTRADRARARHLVRTLTNDLVSDDGGFWPVAHAEPRVSLDDAIRRALDEDRTELSQLGTAWEAVTRRLEHLPWSALRTAGL